MADEAELREFTQAEGMGGFGERDYVASQGEGSQSSGSDVWREQDSPRKFRVRLPFC